jgi:hypothetical protein
MHIIKRWHYSAALACAALCCAMPAQAYVGPGAGVTLIGALIGLLSAIGLALWAVLRWPVRRYLARRKAATQPAGDDVGSGRPGSGSP